MTHGQENFWREIQNIQNCVVDTSITKMPKYGNMEMLLNDVTYDTIYGMLELLDGHKNNAIRGEIRDMNTGKCINSNTELHNYCETYLKCSEIWHVFVIDLSKFYELK